MRMRFLFTASASLCLMLGSASPALGQVAVAGTPVDRNVGDTGPNAASQRLTQPGLGQFGVGSLLVDRYGGNDPYQTMSVDAFAADPRVGQRYLLRSPGVTALLARPDYIGPSPEGGWVFNEQTVDGAEVLTLTPANTVYVLSPQLLRPQNDGRENPAYADDNPNRYQPRTLGGPNAMIQDTRVDTQVFARPAYSPPPQIQAPRDETYRHPAIIERERKLREERQREAIEQAQAEAEAEQRKAEENAEAESDDKAGEPDERDETPNPSDADTSSSD